MIVLDQDDDKNLWHIEMHCRMSNTDGYYGTKIFRFIDLATVLVLVLRHDDDFYRHS